VCFKRRYRGGGSWSSIESTASRFSPSFTCCAIRKNGWIESDAIQPPPVVPSMANTLCPNCQRAGEVPDFLAKMAVNCISCGARVTILVVEAVAAKVIPPAASMDLSRNTLANPDGDRQLLGAAGLRHVFRGLGVASDRWARRVQRESPLSARPTGRYHRGRRHSANDPRARLGERPNQAFRKWANFSRNLATFGPVTKAQYGCIGFWR